jgi:large conductance mechanosensitive channel
MHLASPRRMGYLAEFKKFALKGNVVDLAVAVVIGAAFGKIVTALVEGVIMPLVGRVMPAGDWVSYQVGGMRVGLVLGAVIDFLVVALVLFLVVVKLLGALSKRQPPPPATKACPECLENIPIPARRCRACSSVQP